MGGDMIENDISEYIYSQLAVAYPAISPKQIIVSFPAGKMDYGRYLVRDSIGSEVLTAQISIFTEDAIDRLPFIKAFRCKDINIAGMMVSQSYKNHINNNYIDAAMHKGATFVVEYTYDIVV